MDTKYWLVVVSRDHMEKGKALGIVQANHGKAAPLKRMKPGDLVVFYSPKLRFLDKEPCKMFTAVARVKDGDVYQGDMGGGFTPFRRDVEFLRCEESEIQPVIPRLTFIKNKQSWGFVFRYGFFEIPEKDFQTIASSMNLAL
jgi:predicted RNA-binding protein